MTRNNLKLAKQLKDKTKDGNKKGSGGRTDGGSKKETDHKSGGGLKNKNKIIRSRRQMWPGRVYLPKLVNLRPSRLMARLGTGVYITCVEPCILPKTAAWVKNMLPSNPALILPLPNKPPLPPLPTSLNEVSYL